MQTESTTPPTPRQLADEYIARRKLAGISTVEAFVAGYEAGRASVPGDTSAPVNEHGLCEHCGALDPCPEGACRKGV